MNDGTGGDDGLYHDDRLCIDDAVKDELGKNGMLGVAIGVAETVGEGECERDEVGEGECERDEV
jgi:hypothetical protein